MKFKVNGVKVITAVLPLEPAAAKDLMFKLRQAVPAIGSPSSV
jgi:alanyl-tRNA synthetase